ncbi:MAG: hypothetical protein M1820_008066 [Bogoriella megaspora]|nr:MAG: hypothetical protein M1820_008066 [Bogoriella megaspora]
MSFRVDFAYSLSVADHIRVPALRTRTGCQTCRIRRVKCDEGKPACNRCVSTGRKCDGYDHAILRRKIQTSADRRDLRTSRKSRSPGRSTNKPSLSQGLALENRRSDDEARILQFYRESTVHKVTEIYWDEFWSVVVLQLSLQEPAIKHGLLALSILHEETLSGGKVPFRDTSAITQYGHAISNARNLVGRAKSAADSVEKLKVLVTCILLLCYDNLVGNYNRARIHLQTGLRLFKREYAISGQFGSQLARGEAAAIERIFTQLDLQAMSFSDASAPYPYVDELSDDSETDSIKFTDPTSVPEALKSLFQILCSAFRLSARAHALGLPHLDVSMESAGLKNLLSQWTFFYAPLHSQQTDVPLSKSLSLLKIYHHTASILLNLDSTAGELAWDAHELSFTSILDFASTIIPHNSTPSSNTSSSSSPPTNVFMLTPSLTIPLFLTAFRCRHPMLRRRAISLLESLNSTEGPWGSAPAAKVAAAVMKIEEKSRVVKEARDVKLEDRVSTLVTRVVREVGRVWVSFVVRDEGASGGWKTWSEIVDF